MKKKNSLVIIIWLVMFANIQAEPLPVTTDNMVFIPSAPFISGSKGKLKHGDDGGDGRVGLEVGVDELPAHKVEVDAFYIDQYEVINEEYKKFIEATGRNAPEDDIDKDAPYNWKEGNFPEGEEKHPVTNISWFEADAYCRWKGKRLPTESEWEKACKGKNSVKWSFGRYFISQYANTRELNLEWSQAVGSFPEDKSGYGVFDLSGNVTEWVSSWYDSYPGSTLERETFGKKNRVIRGGSFLTDSMTARCANRSCAVPVKKHRTLGFRCAKD